MPYPNRIIVTFLDVNAFDFKPLNTIEIWGARYRLQYQQTDIQFLAGKSNTKAFYSLIGFPEPTETKPESTPTAPETFESKSARIRQIADEAQRIRTDYPESDRIALGNALLRIRRIIDGVE